MPLRSFLFLALLGAAASLHAEVVLTSAAGFQTDRPFAPNEIISAFGEDLAHSTEAALELPLPTEIAGSSVSVTDSSGAVFAAELFFVSPGQVNFLVPGDVALGEATVSFTNGDGLAQSASLTIAAVSPGVVTLNPQGLAAAQVLRVAADGAQSIEEVYTVSPRGAVIASPIAPAAEGEELYLFIYGSGIRGHAGVESIALEVGGFPAEVLFAGAQGLAGLDQINAGPLSPLLSGRADAEIYLQVGGRVANMPSVDFGGTIAAIRPDIIRVAPDVMRLGESVPDFEVRGRNLGETSAVEVRSNAGLTLGEISVADDAVDLPFAVAADAATGSRMISVLTPAGRSKWASLELVDLDEDAPVVSNLSFTATVSNAAGLIVNVSADWRDPDGDIQWTGSLAGSAYIEIDLEDDESSCGFLLSGPAIFGGLGGDRSGHASFSGPTLRHDLAERGTGRVSITLVDGSGNRSNTTTGEVQAAPICEPGSDRIQFIL